MSNKQNPYFPNLASPIRVGPLTLRNRIVSSANFTALAENNLPSERFAYYHAEKAKGGLALTITGELAVSPSSRFSLPRSIHAYDPACIPGFKLMTEMVHENGALAVAQLQHAGARQYGFDPYGMSVKLPMAPSSLATTVDPDGYTVPMSMDRRQIDQELEFYKRAATNLVEAGFDGVEIKSDSSSLPAQFLSPLTNRRTDEYGGSLENRMRFLDSVISTVYEVTGGKKKIMVGIKIPGDEFTEGGLTHDDMKRVARHIDRENSVNYIAVGGGNLGFDPDLNTPSAYYPQGLFVSLARGIRSVVSDRIKVVALGRIVEPSFAEEVIASGSADMVIMMRAMIADPELPRKAFEGRVSEIIPCIGCNQGCLFHVLTNRPTTCILNPTISREKVWGIGTVKKAEQEKRVVIVGAGPAGVECARIASARGHDVILYEQSSRVGGQANLSALMPGRTDVSRAIRFWEHEIDRLGIKLIKNRRATPEEILGLKPDVVVCATGAAPGKKGESPAFPPPRGTQFLKDIAEIFSADLPKEEGGSALPKLMMKKKEGEEEDARCCVIYDDRGDFQAFGLAEKLLDFGAAVTVITRHPMVGPFVEPWTRLTACKRLLPRGARFISDSYLKDVSPYSVTYYNIFFPKAETTLASDAVFYLSWPIPNNSLKSEIESRNIPGLEVYSIGDCVAPRSIEEAVYEGHELGRRL